MDLPVKKILVFLFLTFAFSSIFYYLSAQGSHYGYSLYLMWCPGVAAFLTQWIFHRSLRGLGLQRTKWKYLLWGYALPVLYGAVTYGLIWLTGLGKFEPFERVQFIKEELQIGMQSPILLLILYLVGYGTIGMLANCGAALGEEIGWRGLLVPELSRKFTFTMTALISGLVWVVWHAPVIVFSDYNTTGIPTWYVLVCFTVLVVGSSFAYAWLRLVSGSIWPAVILHAAHNVFIQAILNPLTGYTAPTPYVIGEFGAGLALAAVVIAFLFWRRRSELPPWSAGG